MNNGDAVGLFPYTYTFTNTVLDGSLIGLFPYLYTITLQPIPPTPEQKIFIMPVGRIKNTIPNVRTSKAIPSTNTVSDGALIGLFPYLYTTVTTTTSTTNNSTFPTVGMKTKTTPVVSARIFNY